MSASRKSILYLGRPQQESLEKLKTHLSTLLGKEIVPTLIVAKDGAEAALKASNQKFEAVIVESKSTRLKESGFFSGYRTNKNTAHADLFVLPADGSGQIPEELKEANHILSFPWSEETLAETVTKSLLRNKAPSAAAPTSLQYAIDAKVLNALLKATTFVCSQFGIDKIQLQKPELKDLGTPWKGDVAASIAIRSQRFQGHLLVSFDEKVYLKMLTSMLGEEQQSINADNADAIGEVSNMILGNAKSDFTDYNVDMSLPVLLQKGRAIEAPPGSAELLIPGATDFGCIYIQVVAHPYAA